MTGEPLEPWPGHDDPLPRDKATQALLPGGESVVSGLEELNQRVNQYLSRQVIQFAVVFAAIAILLGVMTLFFDLQRHVTGAILPGETAVEQLEAGIASANASADDADQALRDRLTIVEEQLEALGAEVERQGQGGGG